MDATQFETLRSTVKESLTISLNLIHDDLLVLLEQSRREHEQTRALIKTETAIISEEQHVRIRYWGLLISGWLMMIAIIFVSFHAVMQNYIQAIHFVILMIAIASLSALALWGGTHYYQRTKELVSRLR